METLKLPKQWGVKPWLVSGDKIKHYQDESPTINGYVLFETITSCELEMGGGGDCVHHSYWTTIWMDYEKQLCLAVILAEHNNNNNDSGFFT